MSGYRLDPDTRDEYVHDIVLAHLDDEAAEAVNRCEAFTALAVTLARAGGDDAAEMGAVFDRVVAGLDEGTVRWLAQGADTPAAFLQSKIKGVMG